MSHIRKLGTRNLLPRYRTFVARQKVKFLPFRLRTVSNKGYVNFILGLLHRVDVGGVADVSEVHAAFNFRLKVWLPHRPHPQGLTSQEQN
jgi:hypothetical protein